MIFGLLSNIPYIRDFPLIFANEEGFRFYAKIQDWWRFSKSFEPLTYKFLTSNTESSDIFLDVGAHIGLYTIRLAEKFQKVVALEPEPQNYTLLYRNVVMYGLNNKVLVLPIAAPDKNGYAILCIKISSGAHTLENNINCKRKMKILSLKIDTLLRLLNIDRTDVIKIDVEGHENKVINGMYRLLHFHPPRILVIETRRENSELREFFARLGYRVFMLDCWNSTCNYGFYLVK
jgi:FkbM family methyltransferase